MKINKLIYTLVGLIVVLASCKDDFLEEKQDYGGFNEQVFKDAALATGYVDYVYGMFLPPANAQSMTWNLATANDDFTKTTEELAGETNWNKEWATISYNNAHALPYFGARLTSSIANNTWTRMKEINIFLKEIDNGGLPQTTRDRLKGQMYFWRAWQYFELVRLYGGVPLVLTPQNPIISAGENTAIQRSSSSETFDQIVKDLDQAIALLPGKWTGSDVGRITSGAAAALKGRALLTWASPLFNRTDDKTRWESAYQANLAAKTLLEANGFGLYKVGTLANATAWGNMWFVEGNTFNPEAVLVFGFNNITTGNPQKNNGWENAIRSKATSGGGSVSPTKEMVDAFPMKDGKPAGSSTYTYSINKFYKDRDPRFYKTFVYNGAAWPYKENANYKQWTYVWKKTATATTYNATTETLGANASGVYLCKASNPNASNQNGINFSVNGADYMEIRFAEVLLNLAESAVGSDRFAEGLTHLKAIRERAGVENLDGSYGLAAISGRDPLFAAILNERRIELAYEGKRFWDLRRWMLFEAGTTTSRLGFTPLNDMRRTGFFISVKTSATGAEYIEASNSTTTKDPLIKPSTGNAFLIDRDATTYPSGVTAATYLDYLYDNYFKVTVKDDLDRTAAPAFKFKWYPQYYFFGINNNTLTASPYLLQTQGWDGLNGPGTFDPLK